MLLLGLSARPAAAVKPPVVRAIDDSSLFVPPGGNTLEEVVTLNRDVSLTLLRAPLGARIQFADWPVAPGLRRTVTLERHDIYAADAKIVKIVPEGIVEVPRSRWLFFWGDDAEGANRVVVSVDPDNATLHAMSMSDEGVSELTFQPGGASSRYRLGDPAAFAQGMVPPSWTCGAEALPPEPPSRPGERPLWIGQESLNPQSVESVNKSGVIAIDTDNEYMLNRFANNTTNAVNWIASLVANTNVIYERDVSIHVFQGYTILRLSTVADPYVTGSGGNADGTKLSDFSNYWSTHYGSIKRTVAAMLSGKQPGGGGASGIAWIGGLCSSSVGYSFNQLFTSAYLFGDTLIFGHEVGHNFGSPHTHCYGPPADMCYSGESGCYSGPTSCPPSLNINGYVATGTLMSYCHLSPCSSTTTLAFHPRTLTEYFNTRITTAISAGCIFNVGGSLPSGPAVTNISPPTGTTAGGTSVTITGTNFSLSPKPTVSFADLSGSVSLTVTTVTATSISATTPAHAAGVMDVVVMNSDSQTATLPGGFTYGGVVTPTVSAVTPSFGPTAGGTLATIVGTNFQNGATVTFDGLAATNVTFVNSSTITAVTPADSAGTVDVLVSNPGPQTGTLSNGFLYQDGTNFYALTPCRILDTRNATGPLGGPALAANSDRTFTVISQCGIPSTALAISVNATVTNSTASGDVRLYAGGGRLPVSITIDYSSGQTRANNMIAPIGTVGGLAVHCDQSSGSVQFILDVNGYFQ
jgi:hypothetical protein